MEINFEVTQEMYLLLRKIEERVNSLRVCLGVRDNREDGYFVDVDGNYDDQLHFLDGDETYNIGEYAEKILSYIRTSCDKDMMLECCKIDRAILHELMIVTKNKRIINSLYMCVGSLFKIHNIALEKIWGIDAEDIENCKYCIDIYGKCYRRDGDKWTLISKAGEGNKQMNNSEQGKQELPDVLNTEEAYKYWEKAKKAGFIKDNFEFKGTKYQMAYFAELMSDKLNLKPKWKPFATLWGEPYLSQTRRESKERFGKVPRSKEIDSIFT